ncbi:MAG: YceI family protein [Urechidicola sp.]|nr:YceI family protein [Urechidicola sp.]
MKNSKIILIILFISIGIFSCKKESKKVDDAIKVSNEFSIDDSSIKMNWVAFKTTDKVAVKGQFNKVDLNKTSGKSVIDFLNGLEFSVPVSSIFTDNDERDSKLQKFFFGVMENTELLSGSITITDDKDGVIHLNMNGITSDIPIKFKSNNNGVSIKGKIDLDNWNSQNAIESLNKACLDLHAGDDGISKTWNTVIIDVGFTELK